MQTKLHNIEKKDVRDAKINALFFCALQAKIEEGISKLMKIRRGSCEIRAI
ncbi:hypothetical protein [Paenibacillus qinlingensis]|uniref:hypothetical protein n=1 Tax=Paenibacillus qinlingensis TaxID=1837343 RepID=UPI00286D1CD5|nr:hypothetical protein [Paenibacillus qinlingensis]